MRYDYVLLVLWILLWIILGAIIWAYMTKLENTAKEEYDIACYWCYTLVDGHCKDDTNWSKWCYNNFEWDRPVNDYYD